MKKTAIALTRSRKISKAGLFILVLLLKQGHAYSQNYYPDKYKTSGQAITSVRIASVSVVPDKWEKEINWNRVESMTRKAAGEGGATVVVTPEGILEGYVVEEPLKITDPAIKNKVIDRLKAIAEPGDGPYIRKACSLANELNIYFIFGFLESRDSKLYNTAILIDPDGDIIGKYSKTHFAKPPYETPGNEYPVFDTPFGKVGIVICHDRQLPEPARIMALKGAQILFVPAYGSYTDENGWNTALMRTRAYENKFPVVFCHPFQSLLIDGNGNIKAAGNAGEVVYYDTDTSPRSMNDRFKSRRPETYQELLELQTSYK